MDNTVKTPMTLKCCRGCPLSRSFLRSFSGCKRGRISRLLNADSNGHQDLRRGTSVFFDAAVADVRGLSVPAHFPLAFSARASATSDPGDERTAARGKNNSGRQPGGHARPSGDNTLLLDGDLRKPGVSRAMEMSDSNMRA